MAIPAHAAGKKKAPIGVIVAAIVIALLLAAVAVFAYMKTQNKAASSNNPKVPTIGVSDVSETEKQLDDSLSKVSDDTDFAVGDLSDASLGL
jgi:flagellar basal body-associated protein FliL